MITRCLLSFLSVLLIGCHCESEKPLFPEKTLTSWGYETTELTEEFHLIRSIKNYGNAEEAFYARFHLSVRDFENPSAAMAEKEKFEAALKAIGPDLTKDYRQYLQSSSKLYVIDPISNWTRMSHQADLMKKIETYLRAKESKS